MKITHPNFIANENNFTFINGQSFISPAFVYYELKGNDQN